MNELSFTGLVEGQSVKYSCRVLSCVLVEVQPPTTCVILEEFQSLEWWNCNTYPYREIMTAIPEWNGRDWREGKKGILGHVFSWCRQQGELFTS